MRDFIYSMCVGGLWGVLVLLPLMLVHGTTPRAAAVLVVLMMLLCALLSLVLTVLRMPGER